MCTKYKQIRICINRSRSKQEQQLEINAQQRIISVLFMWILKEYQHKDCYKSIYHNLLLNFRVPLRIYCYSTLDS